jgi:hypothetical protein
MSGASNAKVGIYDPETGEEAIITDGALHVYLDTPVSVDVDVATEGIATDVKLDELKAILEAIDSDTDAISNGAQVTKIFDTTGTAVDVATSANQTNIVSTKNSTSTPLLANGTWAGEWEDVSSYDYVQVVAAKTLQIVDL